MKGVSAIMLNERTRAYHVAMPNAIGGWALLLDERGTPLNIAWEFGNHGLEGVHAQHAIETAQRRFERVDAIFRGMIHGPYQGA